MKSELQIAAGKLVREIFAVKPGESVVLTADYGSSEEVLRAVEASVREAGATVMTVTGIKTGSARITVQASDGTTQSATATVRKKANDNGWM